MQGTQQDITTAAWEKMLNSLDPRVAEAVEKKYTEDTEKFIQEAKEASPSSDPKYWAKRSCNKCYGRGAKGKKHEFAVGEQAEAKKDEQGKKKKEYTNSSVIALRCSCSENNYVKWLKEFRREYNMNREGDENVREE